jgi:CheY-like chemotaxis protein
VAVSGSLPDEDEPLIRMGLVDLGERSGYRTVKAQDGVHALKQLEAEPAIALVVGCRHATSQWHKMLEAMRSMGRLIPAIITSGKVQLASDDLPPGVPLC